MGRGDRRHKGIGVGVKIAYVISSGIWQLAVLAGGATFSYLTGNYWWLTGGIILMLMAAGGLGYRLDKWEADGGQDNG